MREEREAQIRRIARAEQLYEKARNDWERGNKDGFTAALLEAIGEGAGASVYLLHGYSRACIVDDTHAGAAEHAGQAFQDDLVTHGKDAVRGLVATYLPVVLLTRAWGREEKPYAVSEETIGEEVE